MPPGGPPPPGYGQPPHPYPPGAPVPQRKSSGGVVAIVVAVAAVLLLAVAGAGIWAYTALAGGAAAAGGATVQIYEDLDATHVEVGETVDYGMYPPVGGPHYPMWQNCGVYDELLQSEYVVHSMEHGAVWITYDPSLSAEESDHLASLYDPGAYIVVSPQDGLPAPVVASAWGAQISFEDPFDPALEIFLRDYVQGPATPEPGAACSGAHSGTESDPGAGAGADGGVTA